MQVEKSLLTTAITSASHKLKTKQSMMKGLRGIHLGVAGCLVAGVLTTAGSVHAAQFKFNGDMNNRFQLYSNQRDWFNGSGGTGKREKLKSSGERENYAEIKYRFWFEAATDNNEVKGVYAIEVGGVRFGEGSAGDFSGDGTNLETRWAYIDFGLPDSLDHRIKVGLQPVTVDQHLWHETAMGVMLSGPLSNSSNYQLLWARGDSSNEGDSAQDKQDSATDDGFDGADNFSLNLSSQLTPELKGGAFVLYQTNDQISEGTGTLDAINYEIKSIADNSKYDLLSIGATGDYSTAIDSGKFFAKGTAIYQNGDIEGLNFKSLGGSVNSATSYDVDAYFLRADLGIDYGATKWTYTFWYASGDSNDSDKDLDAFIATDVDINESMIFQENFTDDDYFAETPYLANKGFLFNKVQVEHKISSKVKLTGMAIYNMLAEDVTLGDGSKDNALGLELGGRVSYKLYANLELAAEAAYLIAGDAMDAFEESSIQDGKGSKNIFHTAARMRYKF